MTRYYNDERSGSWVPKELTEDNDSECGMSPLEILNAINELEVFVHAKMKPSSPLFKMAIIRLSKLNTLFYRSVGLDDD